MAEGAAPEILFHKADFEALLASIRSGELSGLAAAEALEAKAIAGKRSKALLAQVSAARDSKEPPAAEEASQAPAAPAPEASPAEAPATGDVNEVRSEVARLLKSSVQDGSLCSLLGETLKGGKGGLKDALKDALADEAAEGPAKKAALLIIDVQNDFISGTMAVAGSEAIVPVINGLREKFEVVAVSYDWHPKEHCSFVESARDGQIEMVSPPDAYDPFMTVTLKADSDRPEHPQMLYPRHCVQGEWGSECHADLVVKENDLKVYKGVRPNIDSYSAFHDNMKANDTGLTALLQKEGVTDVYCCGLVTDICVKASALHSAEAGFKTFVIKDGSRPFVPDKVEEAYREMSEHGVTVVTADEVAV